MSATANGGIVRHGPIPTLDGIRALAVTLVFFAHGGLENIVPGGLGVTVFFVLSGFLITTLMRIEWSDSGTLQLRAFFLRRALRLGPPLVLTVGVAGLLSLAGWIGGRFSAGGLLCALFYGGNYFVIAQDFHGLPDGLGVIWSLAVEEHFYLVFPLLALPLLRLRNPRLQADALGMLCAMILAWRCVLNLRGGHVAHILMATDTRIDTILAGCLLALRCNPWLDARERAWCRRDALLLGGSLTVLLATLLIREAAFRLTLRYTLQSGAVAVLMYCCVVHAQRWPFRWLDARPLRYLGGISYSVYLIHHIALEGLHWRWPAQPEPLRMLLAAALTLLFAEPVRRWVDPPFARLRRRLHPRSQPGMLREAAP